MWIKQNLSKWNIEYKGFNFAVSKLEYFPLKSWVSHTFYNFKLV